MIKIKRIYEKDSKKDGHRILVDRLWPRGLAKQDAGVDLWLKEVGPSVGLRKWFAHDPEKWSAFKRKYKLEIKQHGELIDRIKQLEKKNGVITLLFSSKDEKFNNAVVLRSFLVS